jgi:RimJ/RimL family protein N-acetyltransferase
MEANPTRSELTAESIDGAGVRLRRYRDEDVPDVQAGCDDPLIQRFLPQMPMPYTHADAEWWVVEGSGAAFANGGGNFVIADPETDRLVGGIGVTRYRDGNGEIGYWVAPWARRRGVATRAVGMLHEWAVSELGLRRIEILPSLDNGPSRRVAERCGYTDTGEVRALPRDPEQKPAYAVYAWEA